MRAKPLPPLKGGDTPTIRIERNHSPVDLDLVFATLRLPYRQRLAIVVNELGTGLAGRPAELNAAIRRANPALQRANHVLAILDRDRSHPSIVTWVPLNESWGVQHLAHDERMVSYAKALVHLTKTVDPTRPVISNDGWEHAASDILSIHDYDHDATRVAERYATREAILGAEFTFPGRRLIVDPSQRTDAPLMLTEFGGIAYRAGAQRAQNEWGYSGIEPTKEAMLRRLDGLVKAIVSNPAWAGFCYTQLTDVEQEINGLMTYDRKPKAAPEEFKRIFEQR